MPEEIVCRAQSWREIRPAWHACYWCVLASGDEGPCRQLLRGHIPAKIIEAKTVVEGQAFDRPLILGIQAEIRVNPIPFLRRHDELRQRRRPSISEDVGDAHVGIV